MSLLRKSNWMRMIGAAITAGYLLSTHPLSAEESAGFFVSEYELITALNKRVIDFDHTAAGYLVDENNNRLKDSSSKVSLKGKDLQKYYRLYTAKVDGKDVVKRQMGDAKDINDPRIYWIRLPLIFSDGSNPSAAAKETVYAVSAKDIGNISSTNVAFVDGKPVQFTISINKGDSDDAIKSAIKAALEAKGFRLYTDGTFRDKDGKILVDASGNPIKMDDLFAQIKKGGEVTAYTPGGNPNPYAPSVTSPGSGDPNSNLRIRIDGSTGNPGSSSTTPGNGGASSWDEYYRNLFGGGAKNPGANLNPGNGSGSGNSGSGNADLSTIMASLKGLSPDQISALMKFLDGMKNGSSGTAEGSLPGTMNIQAIINALKAQGLSDDQIKALLDALKSGSSNGSDPMNALLQAMLRGGASGAGSSDPNALMQALLKAMGGNGNGLNGFNLNMTGAGNLSPDMLMKMLMAVMGGQNPFLNAGGNPFNFDLSGQVGLKPLDAASIEAFLKALKDKGASEADLNKIKGLLEQFGKPGSKVSILDIINALPANMNENDKLSILAHLLKSNGISAPGKNGSGGSGASSGSSDTSEFKPIERPAREDGLKRLQTKENGVFKFYIIDPSGTFAYDKDDPTKKPVWKKVNGEWKMVDGAGKSNEGSVNGVNDELKKILVGLDKVDGIYGSKNGNTGHMQFKKPVSVGTDLDKAAKEIGAESKTILKEAQDFMINPPASSNTGTN